MNAWPALLLLLGMVLVASPAVWASTTAVRKQEARVQFDKAEQMREALNGRPAGERTRREYQRVIDAYRKVYYGDPAASKADASVLAVAELLAEAGRQFQPDEKDLQSAIGQYRFLRKEYPGSKYRVEALFTIGQIYKEDLGDEAGGAGDVPGVREAISPRREGDRGEAGAGGAESGEEQDGDNGGEGRSQGGEGGES